MSGQEPEDTVPFTHHPYGKAEDDNPLVSPSGPASQPSGPSFVTPGPPPPPVVGPLPPYGAPGQQPWQSAWAPTYGVPMAGSLDHKGATTSLVLGVISVASLALGLFCCITFPGMLCAPFAWVIGAKARHEIDMTPNTYGNRSSAQAGLVMGATVSILGTAVILLVAALIIFFNISNWSLV